MANPITLNYLTVPGTTSGWKTVVSDNSVTKNTTSSANGNIVKSKVTAVASKKAYDKIKTTKIGSKDKGWVASGTNKEKNNVWHTKTFKESYKNSKGKTKYRKWTTSYYNKYRERYSDDVRYNFPVQPSSMNITYQDLDIEDENVGTDVGRDRTTGHIVRNRVLTNVRTIECEFAMLTQAQARQLLPMINATASYSGFLKLNFTDALSGEDTTITCYAGDRSIEAGHFGRWLNLKVTFVEK